MALTKHKNRVAFPYSPIPFLLLQGAPSPLPCSLPHLVWTDVESGCLVAPPWVDFPAAAWPAAVQGWGNPELFSLSAVFFCFACSPALAGWTWTSSARSCSTTATWTRMGKFRNLNWLCVLGLKWTHSRESAHGCVCFPCEICLLLLIEVCPCCRASGGEQGHQVKTWQWDLHGGPPRSATPFVVFTRCRRCLWVPLAMSLSTSTPAAQKRGCCSPPAPTKCCPACPLG